MRLPEMITPSEAADILKLSPSSVYRLIREGKIEVVIYGRNGRTGFPVAITRSSVERIRQERMRSAVKILCTVALIVLVISGIAFRFSYPDMTQIRFWITFWPRLTLWSVGFLANLAVVVALELQDQIERDQNA